MDGDAFEIYTMDHDTGEERLDLRHMWSDMSPTQALLTEVGEARSGDAIGSLPCNEVCRVVGRQRSAAFGSGLLGLAGGRECVQDASLGA